MPSKNRGNLRMFRSFHLKIAKEYVFRAIWTPEWYNHKS